MKIVKISKNKYPKMLVAPNGKNKVTIYKDNYVQFDDETTEEEKELIYECSKLSINMLPPKAKPIEAFIKMGWKEI